MHELQPKTPALIHPLPLTFFCFLCCCCLCFSVTFVVMFAMFVVFVNFSGTSTADQIKRIVALTGRPTKEDIDGLNAPQAVAILEALGLYVSGEENLDDIEDAATQPRAKLSTVELIRHLHARKKVDLGPEKYVDRSEIVREMFPDAPLDALSLLAALTHFNPDRRITPEDALNHPYFSDLKDPVTEVASSRPFAPDLRDDTRYTIDEYRQALFGKPETPRKLMRKASKSILDLEPINIPRTRTVRAPVVLQAPRDRLSRNLSAPNSPRFAQDMQSLLERSGTSHTDAMSNQSSNHSDSSPIVPMLAATTVTTPTNAPANGAPTAAKAKSTAPAAAAVGASSSTPSVHTTAPAVEKPTTPIAKTPTTTSTAANTTPTTPAAATPKTTIIPLVTTVTPVTTTTTPTTKASAPSTPKVPSINGKLHSGDKQRSEGGASGSNSNRMERGSLSIPGTSELRAVAGESSPARKASVLRKPTTATRPTSPGRAKFDAK
eukprot:c19536_g1_i1.p1 GENE.c19536_g1_i1~~c19536_g1_i1.p1  ORF type:complete len:492 (+),score=100.30 c19536_g1_i1:1360-2835(+)